jgi:hypothetical protein
MRHGSAWGSVKGRVHGFHPGYGAINLSLARADLVCHQSVGLPDPYPAVGRAGRAALAFARLNRNGRHSGKRRAR